MQLTWLAGRTGVHMKRWVTNDDWCIGLADASHLWQYPFCPHSFNEFCIPSATLLRCNIHNRVILISVKRTFAVWIWNLLMWDRRLNMDMGVWEWLAADIRSMLIHHYSVRHILWMVGRSLPFGDCVATHIAHVVVANCRRPITKWSLTHGRSKPSSQPAQIRDQ